MTVDEMTGLTTSQLFTRIRDAVERISARGHVVDSLDVADLALVLLLCPIESPQADQRPRGSLNDVQGVQDKS